MEDVFHRYIPKDYIVTSTAVNEITGKLSRVSIVSRLLIQRIPSTRNWKGSMTIGSTSAERAG